MSCKGRCQELCEQLIFIPPQHQEQIIQIVGGMIAGAPKFCGDRGILVRNFKSPASVPNVLKVLIVEDEVEMRNSLKQIIEVAMPPCEVHFAATGAAAIELISEHPWDIAFMDINLADDITGVEVYWYAKNHLPSLNAYLMSGYNVTDHLALLSLRDEEVIKKPFDPALILDIINKHG